MHSTIIKHPHYLRLLLSFLFTATLILFSLLFIDTIDGSLITISFLYPLCRLLVLILLGLMAGQIIESTGLTRRLAIVAKPLFSFANLGLRCSTAFTTAFISGVAANAMLSGFYQDKLINKDQLYLTNLLNQIPAYVLHIPTTFCIILPLAGRAGAIYFGLTFAALLLRTIVLLLFGRFFVTPTTETKNHRNHIQLKTKQESTIIETIRSRLPARLATIVVWVLPLYSIIFLLSHTNQFDQINRILDTFFITRFVPVEALSVVILGFTAEFTSGFAAAGAMLDAGIITIKQTVIALIAGHVLAFPVRALRHQLPRYIGIFAPKMGTQLLLLGQLLRISSIIVVTLLYYYFC